MRPYIRRIATRLVIANLLVLPVLIILISFTTSNAAAASVSGTWSSNVAGKGYVQTSNVIDTNSDVKLVLSQNGDTVSGTITTTCSYSYAHPSSLGSQKPAIGAKNTNTVSGTLSGSTLTLICYSPATSGTSGGISWTAPASTTTWTLYLSGSTLTGSGTYVAAGITYHYAFDLVSGDGSGLSGFSGEVTAPVMFGLFGGLACLVVSFIPAPKGRIPSHPGQMGNAYSYQPSDVGTTQGASGSPTDSTYMGGAGLTYPQNYVNGTPVKPGQWQGQQGPACPIHGTACQAHLISVSDPGAWFCPKCAEQGHGSGYPWGRQ